MNTIIFDMNNLAMRYVYKLANKNDFLELLPYSIFNAIVDFSENMAVTLEKHYTIALAGDCSWHYWRRDIYPQYKADRKEKRSRDAIDWEAVWKCVENFEFNAFTYLPFITLVGVDGCEADDIIYSLAKKSEDCIICSSDSDFVQLIDKHVHLYSPMAEDFVFNYYRDNVCYTPEQFLNWAIITGQHGKDNVFNICTPSDWDCSKRKPGVGSAFVRKLEKRASEAGESLEAYCSREYKDTWERNKKLIDLSQIPEEYSKKIDELLEDSIDRIPNDLDGFLDVYNWPSLKSEFERDKMKARLAAISGARHSVNIVLEATDMPSLGEI